MQRFVTLAFTAGFVAALAACDDGGVTQLREDAGPEPEPEVDAGHPPPPPVFPLKAGDKVRLTGIGGRTEPCAGRQGDCDRALYAEYELNTATLSETTNHWDLDASYLYRLEKAGTTEESIGQLFLSKAAPFDIATVGETQGATAVFATDAAPSDQINVASNGFPFFHFEPAYANEAGSSYAVASSAFTERIRTLDVEANIESQAAASTIAGYFKDELGASPMLHMVEVKYHRFGFICQWDERLMDWVDGMQRSKAQFGNNGIPLAAFYNDVRVIRKVTTTNGLEEKSFRCSCFNQTCQADIDGENRCLNPEDPDEEPSAAACLL